MSLLKIATNSGWYFTEKISALFFGVISSALIARNFGSESIGQLALIQSLSALIIFIPTLGLDHFIIRDLINKKNERETLGSALPPQLAGWLIYLIIFITILAVSNKLNKTNAIILLCIATSTLLTRLSISRFFFDATQDAGVIARSILLSRCASLIYLSTLLAIENSFLMAVYYIAVQELVFFLLITRQYNKKSVGIHNWRFNLSRAKELIKESYPFLLSTALVPIFMNADVVIISSILGDHQAGIYFAAMKLIIPLYLVGHTLTMALYPSIIRLHEKNHESYQKIISATSKLIFICALTTTLIIYGISSQAINVIYGKEFTESSDILKILSIIFIFSMPATLYTRILVLEKKAKYEIAKSFTAAAASITLNITLIPKLGITGAAYSAVIAYSLADLIILYAFKETRGIFKIAISAILCPIKPLKTFAELKSLKKVIEQAQP